MDIYFIFLYIVLGLISGVLAGLLGIGGGVVTVPFLYFIFLYGDFFGERIMHVAVSTSLAAAIVTSAQATYLQWKKKALVLAAFKFLLPGLIFGCAFGSLLAHYLPSLYLERVFGIMAIFLGTYFFFPRLPPLHISHAPNATLSLFALVIGSLSSLLGIGGGSLAFPVLLGYHLEPKNASATSSASTLVTTLFGTLAYLLIAFRSPHLPHTFGYIYLPAFITLSLSTLFTTPLGVKLSHTLDVRLIKRIFGLCLALVGLSLLI